MRAKLVFTITNDDGSPFSSNETSWEGMTREEVNLLEGMGIDFLKSLNQFGAKALKEKESK